MTGVSDDVVLLDTVAAPGEPAPLDHVHNSYDEIFYIIDGEFEFRLDGRIETVEPRSGRDRAPRHGARIQELRRF